MAENPNKEVIEQLERLNDLLEDALRQHEYMETGCAVEYGEKIDNIMLTVDHLNGVPSVFKKCPVFPIDQSDSLAAKQSYESKKKILTVVALTAAICILIFFISHWTFLNTIGSAGVIATIILYFNFSQSKKAYKEKEKAYTDSVTKSEESVVAFRKALAVYETEKASGIQAAQAFAKEYRVAYEKYSELLDEYENSKCTATEKFVQDMQEAKTIDFVPEEYYDFVKPMISMLKSGRAENYKEALNMAIEEDRQAQAEAARREEEARRTRIMEEQAAAEQRRAEEMARHNREMEQQQQMQEKMMIEEQRKQERDMKEYERRQAFEAQRQANQAASEARKQANATKQAGIAKCASCANSRHCPSHIKNNGSGLTCGAYRPYGA